AAALSTGTIRPAGGMNREDRAARSARRLATRAAVARCSSEATVDGVVAVWPSFLTAATPSTVAPKKQCARPAMTSVVRMPWCCRIKLSMRCAGRLRVRNRLLLGLRLRDDLLGEFAGDLLVVAELDSEGSATLGQRSQVG